MGHWEQNFSDAVWGKGAVDYVWVPDYAGEPANTQTKPTVIAGGFNPNDPTAVAGSVATNWQSAYDDAIKQGKDPIAAKAEADRQTAIYMTNNVLDSKAGNAPTGTMGAAKDVSIGALSSTNFLNSYKNYVNGVKKDEAVNTAKQMALSTIPMNKGQRSFSDQTKPGTTKDKWGWWK
jgi:hypothetical protein